MKKKIKAVVFDLDGVLVDAKEWHYFALNKALNHFGYTITREEHLTVYDGLPTKVKLNKLNKDKGLPKKLINFISILKQKYTEQYFFTECNPNFYHQSLMKKLKKNKLKIAVASNSIRKTVTNALELSNLSKFVSFYLSNEDVKYSKPNPEIYLKAAKKLKLKPKNILVVEDNENGIRSAKLANCHVLEVQNVNDVNEVNVFKKISQIEKI